MAGYLIATYRITNPEGFEGYVPAVMPTLVAHSAEVLVADYGSEALEGQPRDVTVILKFASKEAARVWYNSAEYQAIIHLRTDNTEGEIAIVDEWVAPA